MKRTTDHFVKGRIVRRRRKITAHAFSPMKKLAGWGLPMRRKRYRGKEGKGCDRLCVT